MAYVDVIRKNFVSGELTPKTRGRFDLKIYDNGCRRLQNFIAQTQGPADFRTGSIFVKATKNNNKAWLLPFQFNDIQSYLVEVTEGFMRFYKDEGLILEDAKILTGATQADPTVITSASHGFVNGDEVFITGIVGMEELNNKYFIVANSVTNSFSLKDQDGVDIDSTGFGAYISDGTASRVFEIASPYLEAELFQIKFAQNADVMYIVHPNHEPRKLTRTDHDAWTLSTFTRTDDPFTSGITGATKANPAVITSVAHGLSTGDIIEIYDVSGMVELNDIQYTITVLTVDTFELDGVNSTGFTTYTSGGYFFKSGNMPVSVAFNGGRLVYGGTFDRPETFWPSAAVNEQGVPQYDVFTTGTDPDDALVFTLAPVHGKVDSFKWLGGNDKYLLTGTFGGINKLTGGRDDEPIAPGDINPRPIDDIGCANVNPINRGNIIIYIERGSLRIRSFEYDALAENFISVNRNLSADHITESGLTQLAFQRGDPDVLWTIRNDGILLGLTFKSREDVSGWHRHYLGGSTASTAYGKVLSVGVMPRENKDDQLWVVVERVINGTTRRYVEFLKDKVIFPQVEDFFTAPENKAADTTRYEAILSEKQKEYVHVDSALTFNGADRGISADAAVTPGAVTGDSVAFTSDNDVFLTTDVGREIWKKKITGDETGRAKILAYVSATEVTCQVLEDFDSTDEFAAGGWFLTSDSISGLEHLEDEDVKVVSDGSKHPDRTVSSGAISLQEQASVIHVGEKFLGILAPENLEGGGENGPGQTKVKTIEKFGLRLLETLGVKIGTSLYNLKTLVDWSNNNITDRPPPVFSGIKVEPYQDSWTREKIVYVVQDEPVPCTVQFIDIYMEVSNE